MNQSSKSQKNKKFICIFDNSHVVDSEQKLINHMKKCKAMQKQSYQCCQFNPLHWVKYDMIKEHQQNCNDRNKPKSNQIDFSKVLPSDISNFDFTVPFQIDMPMIQQSSVESGKKSVNEKQQKFGRQKRQKELPSMKKKQKIGSEKLKRVQMWKQPNFEEFVKKRGYKQKDETKIYNQNNSFIGNNNSFLF